MAASGGNSTIRKIVPVGAGSRCMGRATGSASPERLAGAVVVSHRSVARRPRTAFQHEAKVAQTALNPSQSVFAGDLCGAAAGIPTGPFRVERQQVPSAWGGEKHEVSILKASVLHAEEPAVKPQRALYVFDHQ